ncbi:MAG TPA: serine/threonine-protein kinase [Gemmatimonadaceae bacterium]|nr:serine/threonine-protein kinase [Gemmatimonadaceae bacterium]
MHEAEDPLRQALVSALGAQYDVLRLIGRGGMGAVYLGRERLLDRLVAIKVLPHESAGTEDARERFLREARTAARLTHPNVVPLFSFGEAGTTLFYIMGYVEGESLEQRLRRDQRIPFDEARRILAELASALEHAHGQGIVHRDIKPDNVLLEHGTGRAVLTDFGIARQQMAGHTITHTGVVVGTPLYMSPEQASGERDIDGRSDMYSLGVMGYRMITGRLPFEGGSFQELIAQHMTRAPAPLSVLAPDVPHDLEAAVQRCLEKNPADRWPSATSLKEALGGGEGEVALPPELERVPASFSGNVIMGWFGAWLGAITYVLSGDLFWGVLPLTVIPGALLEQWNIRRLARKRGLPWRRTWTMTLWPPRSWSWWWPRAFRRPGDVWDRLPDVPKKVRAWSTVASISAAGVFLPAILLGISLGMRDKAPATVLRPLMLVSLFGLLGVLLTFAGALWFGSRWGRRAGLNTHDQNKFLSEPTWTRFWRRPDIAPLLGRNAPAPIEHPLNTPSDFVSALERLTTEVQSHWRDLLIDGIRAAREVVHAVAHIDDEIRVLARDNDPNERQRIVQRLGSMSDTVGGSRQMKELLEGQLTLMNQLTRRSEELASRRSRYMELLRTMWLQFSALRAEHAADALSTAATTGQLRELCRDVEHALAAEHAVAAAVSADAPARAAADGRTPASR